MSKFEQKKKKKKKKNVGNFLYLPIYVIKLNKRKNRI